MGLNIPNRISIDNHYNSIDLDVAANTPEGLVQIPLLFRHLSRCRTQDTSTTAKSED